MYNFYCCCDAVALALLYF